MAGLILAVAAFLISHRLTNHPVLRRAAQAWLGRRGFTIAYSILSLLLLAWIIHAFRQAPLIPLWDQAAWMRWVPPLVMPWACLLAAAGLMAPNPLSIGRGGRGFDPDRPGILRLTRHPVLWAAVLWAAAHVVPNGDVAALVVFLPLLALAVAGPWVLDSKFKQRLGDDEWRRLAARTGVPRQSMLKEMGWRPVLLGLGVYVILLALHPWVIGAWPLP